MIDYYNAFISYRHADLDSKVAEHVQRNLERFHIPHRIRNKTGKKKIERIFRDKDELPITSDLTDTISNALEKADYLIVICSPNTKDSVWVQREIEYFLRNHSKKEILTVLAGGEPDEVIPEILKHDTRKVTDSKGDTYEVDTPVEPLSCDYRMPFSRAKKEELPRLAAAIVGCSYDELVRRQRAYRMRRTMVIGAVLLAAALAFGGYMFYSRQKIDAAYKDSLISRSRYLAKESENLLDNEDRIGALFLALEALPTEEGDDKPVTSEAVCALSDATLAYKGPNGWSIHSVWDYSMSNQVYDFVVSPEGNTLAARDKTLAVVAWNTDDHRKLFEYRDLEDNLLKLKLIDDNNLLMVSGHTLRCVDLTAGKIIWETEYPGYIGEEPQIAEDGNILCAAQGPKMLKIDLKSGKILHTYDFNVNTEEKKAGISEFMISPDKKKIGLFFSTGYNESFSGVYDIATGKLVTNEIGEYSVSNILWTKDGHFITAEYDLSLNSSARFNNTSVLRPNSSFITCYEPETMKQVWREESTSTGVAEIKGLLELGDAGTIAYFEGNRCAVYTVAEGKIVYDWRTSESIVNVIDSDGDGIPFVMTINGGIGTPLINEGNEALSITYYLTDKIKNIEVNGGIYLNKSFGTDIIYYRANVVDEEFKEVDDLSIGYLGDKYIDDNVLALTTQVDDGAQLILIDPADQSVIAKHLIGPGAGVTSGFSILGADEDYVYVVNSDSEGIFVIQAPIKGGDFIKTQVNDRYVRPGITGNLNDGKIAFYDHDNKKYICCLWDTKTKETARFDLSADEGFSPDIPPVYDKDLDCVYLTGQKGDLILDASSGKTTAVSLPENWDVTDKVVYDKVRRVIWITDGKSIASVKEDGSIGLTLSCEGRTPLGFVIEKDTDGKTDLIYVAYSEGELVRYSIDTGDFIASSVISNYVDTRPDATFEFDHANKIMYIQSGELTSVVDMNSWVETAYVQDSFGHHRPTDRFFALSIVSSSDKRIGSYKHYDLNDLIAKARNILKDQKMPEDMRTRYGL